MRSIPRLLCSSLVLAIILTLFLQPLIAQDKSRTGAALGNFLDQKGKLALPSSFKGNLNPAGFRMLLDKDGSPRFVSAAAAVPGDEKWDDRFGYPGISVGAGVNAIAVSSDGAVFIAGDISRVGGLDSVGNIARYDPSTRHWSPLGIGVDNLAWCLAINGDDLYVGGSFETAGGLYSPGVARWTISTSSWSSLGIGINGTNYQALAMAISGGYLYVGGIFTTAQLLSAHNIARWSLSGLVWSQVDSGLTGPQASVRALIPSGSGVIAGGRFNTAGSISASDIARWDGSVWTPVGHGVNSDVYSLASGTGGTIYVGGSFTSATNPDNSTVPVSAIASFNGTWSDMGGGVTASGLPEVDALSFVKDTLFVGGIFQFGGGISVPANNIAAYDGAWHALGSGTGPAGFERVRALGYTDSLLFAGGDFFTAGQTRSRGICAWNDSSKAWEGLGWGVENGEVDAILVVYPDIYVGGIFARAGGLLGVNNIARYHAGRKKWIAMDNGVRGAFPAVYTLGYYGGDVYVGGRFDSAGTLAVHGLARWNPIFPRWEDPGASLSSGDEVHAISVFKSELYVGGNFATIGGVASPGIGRGDGSTWSGVGQGIISFTQVPIVLAIAGTPNILYVGGNFDRVVQTNGAFVDVGNIARWDGSGWSELTGRPDTARVDGNVNAILPNGTSSVYVGGDFTIVETSKPPQLITARRIALWDGHSWSEVAGGILTGSSVNTLTKMDGEIFAGGKFTNAGGTAVNNIAYSDGYSWHALGSGAQVKYLSAVPAVNALAPSRSDTALYTGGAFDLAGAKFSLSFARWSTPQPVFGWNSLPVDSSTILSSVDFSLYPIGFAAGNNGYIAKTTDGGNDWTRLPTGTIDDVEVVLGLSDSLIIAVDDNDQYLKSTDGGATWHATTILSMHGLRNFHWIDEMDGVVVGDSGRVSFTTDGGISWANQLLTQAVFATLTGVYHYDRDTILVVGLGGVVLRTTDAGASWTRVGSTTTSDLNVVFATDIPPGSSEPKPGKSSAVAGPIGFIGGDNGTILRSTDAGATYTLIPSGTIANLYGGGLVDMNNIYFCGDGGIILRSTDGGLSFAIDANSGPAALRGMSFSNIRPQSARSRAAASPTIAYAAGENGVLLTKQIVVSGVSGPLANLPKAFSLSQNYPNPFNPTTTIRYEFPRASHVSLVVYDLLGQEVAVLVNEEKLAGKYQVQFSARGGAGGGSGALASGVYFYRFNAGEFFETKKLLLLK